MRGASEAHVRPLRNPSGLVGRDGELELLRSALAQVIAGASVACVVVGEAGIGKSRLLAELRSAAEVAGCRVLVGQAGEFEQEGACAVFVDALDDYAAANESLLCKRLGAEQVGELAALLPSLAAQGHGPASALPVDRYRRHRGVRAMLEAMAVERPVVLALDDLHWADAGSLELMQALVRRPPKGRVLLVGGLRAHGALRMLDVLGGTVVRVELAVLDIHATRAMLGAGFDDAEVRALHAQSGGVPFYLEQMARAGTLGCDPDPGVPQPVPRAVSSSIEREIAGLGPTARLLLRGAAVAGDPFEVAVGAAAAGVPEAEALDALDQLVGAGLVQVTETPRRLRFRHPIIRNAVYESAGAGWRIGAHERAAAALLAGGGAVLSRAHHVAAAARPGDLEAVAVLGEAGQAASAISPVVGAHWFAEALRVLGDTDPARGVDLRLQHAHALVAAGRMEDGLAGLLAVLERVADDSIVRRVRLVATAAAVERMLGRPGQARARLLATLDALPEAAVSEAALVIGELAMSAAWSGDLAGCVARGEQSLAAARRAGDQILEARALALIGVGANGSNDWARAQSAASQAGVLLDRCSDAMLAGQLDTALAVGLAAAFTDDFVGARRWLERGVSVARASGQGFGLTHLVSSLSTVTAALGRLDAAAELAAAGLEAAQLEADPTSLAWALRVQCVVCWAVGDLSAALRFGEEYLAAMGAVGHAQSGARAGWVMGQVLVDLGDHARARAIVLELGNGSSTGLGFAAGRLAGYDVLTQAELGAGRLNAADHWARQAELAVAGGDGLGVRIGLARRARARVLLAGGDTHAAAQAALDAAACAERSSVIFEAARSRLLAGQALAAAGDTQYAISVLEHAHAVLAECGAKRIRDEAASALRALGQPVARGAPGRRGAGSAATLSPRELEVARLLANGSSNKQVAGLLHVSVNTVESHVGRVLTKLDVPNRAAVASALAAFDQI